MGDELIDIAEVCNILRTSSRSLRRLIANGKFPRPIAVGHRRLWPVKIVREWIEKPYAEAPGVA
jgi:predicted DNA-binding transcriptional regulator AlpA